MSKCLVSCGKEEEKGEDVICASFISRTRILKFRIRQISLNILTIPIKVPGRFIPSYLLHSLVIHFQI